MDSSALLRLSRITRPCMRRKTPVLHGLAKLLLRVSCPKGGRRHETLILHSVPGGRMALDLNASLEYSLFFRGCHEPEIGNLIRRSAPKGGVCLDIGANVGAHTLVMAETVGASGRVLALEPHPRICERLRANVALNGLGQVRVIEAALWDSEGEAQLQGFARGAFQQGISSLVEGPGQGEAHTVRTITAQTLATTHGLDRVDLVKIDAEGAEPAILAQLDGLIERCLPHLIFEYREASWRKQGQAIEPVLRRLRELGYLLHFVHRDATAELAGPPPPSCEIYCVPGRRGAA